jgi:hypothetical protein
MKKLVPIALISQDGIGKLLKDIFTPDNSAEAIKQDAQPAINAIVLKHIIFFYEQKGLLTIEPSPNTTLSQDLAKTIINAHIDQGHLNPNGNTAALLNTF